MKKLRLKLDIAHEILSKEQMKKISGGSSNGFWCYFDAKASCGGGETPAWCNLPNDPDYCAQLLYDSGCANNPCCADVDCDSGHG